jgi:hypothetical protein
MLGNSEVDSTLALEEYDTALQITEYMTLCNSVDSLQGTARREPWVYFTLRRRVGWTRLTRSTSTRRCQTPNWTTSFYAYLGANIPRLDSRKGRPFLMMMKMMMMMDDEEEELSREFY